MCALFRLTGVRMNSLAISCERDIAKVITCIYTVKQAKKTFYSGSIYTKNEKHLQNEQKVEMLLQKRADTRGVG